MAERPILFSGPMVRAIIDGRKTQTRRVFQLLKRDGTPAPPRYAPGDRLWVRETWGVHSGPGVLCTEQARPNVALPSGGWSPVVFRATTEGCAWGMYGSPRWRPSIHMPRSASRITLEVTDVRVQRLRDISPEDVEAEGVVIPWHHRGDLHDRSRWKHDHFRPLWDSINGTPTGRKVCGGNCEYWKGQITAESAAVDRIKSELRRLGTARTPDPKAAHWGKIAGALGFDRSRVEYALVLIEPVLWALMFELCSIIAFGFAFYHPARVRHDAPQPPAKPENVVDLRPIADASTPKSSDEALADLRHRIRTGGSVSSQAELAAAWHRTEGCVSKWLHRWQSDGLIARERDGRFKLTKAA